MPGTITLLDQDRGGEWDPLLGQTVGSYRIARLLGRGGMGAVYLARQPAIGAQVAIKFLHPRFSADRAVVERFFNEARAVNLIGHENIVKILDFSVTPEGRYYFVMEYLDGGPLSQLTAARQPLPLSITGPILLQCCRALQAAHARGIVHRDLKPDNVFLVQQMGRKHFVKLVDFGIAKLEQAAEGAGLTQAGTVIGTPEYMSPEQAAGRTGEVGRRSDVYSLGVVMYQLACGRVPFSGASTAQTLVAQMELPPQPPRQVAPGVPEEVEAIVLKALAKKREDRFQSMQELHAALSATMQKLGVSAELPPADEPAPEAAGGAGDPAPQPDPQPDPRFATQAAPPTQTRAGVTAPASERAARLADWLLAPSRRLRTLAAAAAVVLALLFVSRSRSPEPAPRPAPRPAEPAPRAAPPAPPPAPPVQPEAPKLLPPSPAQLAAAAQEKARHKKKEPPPAAKPAASAPPPLKPAAPAPPPAKPAAPAPLPAKPAAPVAAKPVAPAAPEGPPQPLTAAEAARAAAAAAQPKKKGESEADKVARATREMGEAAAAAAREEAALPSLPRSAKLYVVSDPLGASVTAAWAGKSATGETPVVFRVLRGAKVTLTFSKPGHAPAVQEVAAAATRLSVTSLKPLAAP